MVNRRENREYVNGSLETMIDPNTKAICYSFNFQMVGWLIWGLTSHQQQRSYGDGTMVGLIRQTEEACNLWFTRQVTLPLRHKGFTFQMI